MRDESAKILDVYETLAPEIQVQVFHEVRDILLQRRSERAGEHVATAKLNHSRADEIGKGSESIAGAISSNTPIAIPKASY